MLADKRGWAFDVKAQSLIKYLTSFDITLRYVSEKPIIDPNDFDLVYLFWWGERYHRKFLVPKEKVIKEITSHRWQVEPKYFCDSPVEAKERFMFDAQYLVAHSQKLKHLFGLEYIYNAGVDETLMRSTADRSGPLKIGWAGKRNDPIKRFNDLLNPSTSGHDFRVADGSLSYKDMPAFFNSIDVISVSSIAEGTPRPLLEAMACGCFPVTTDVGIAPELIVNGENGLIVDGSVKAFKQAFRWCEENLDYVRKAGKDNQELIHSTRTWRHSAKQFEEIILDILDQKNRGISVGNPPSGSPGIEVLQSMRSQGQPERLNEVVYKIRNSIIKHRISSHLPVEKLSKILVMGSDIRHLLRYISDEGYYRVMGLVDNEENYLDLMRSLGNKVERIFLNEPSHFFDNYKLQIDCLIINLAFFGADIRKAKKFLMSAHGKIKTGGKILILLPAYLKESQLTRKQLITLFEESGYKTAVNLAKFLMIAHKNNLD